MQGNKGSKGKKLVMLCLAGSAIISAAGCGINNEVKDANNTQENNETTVEGSTNKRDYGDITCAYGPMTTHESTDETTKGYEEVITDYGVITVTPLEDVEDTFRKIGKGY